MYNRNKEYLSMYEYPKDCLSCANSFSESSDNGNDIEESYCYEDYN